MSELASEPSNTAFRAGSNSFGPTERSEGER